MNSKIATMQCVNVGCVPKKLMVYGAHFSHDLHDMKVDSWKRLISLFGTETQLSWSFEAHAGHV
jgi:pyruvate/2-oxoglutarate dehydrogenase complex dihydrolipoamide dehydrogenase (E3) component